MNKEEMEKAKEEAYWKGYIQKQKEAEEICKTCNYRKKYKEVKGRLEKIIKECNKQIAENEDSILEIFPQKILNIIEGEKKVEK